MAKSSEPGISRVCLPAARGSGYCSLSTTTTTINDSGYSLFWTSSLSSPSLKHLLCASPPSIERRPLGSEPSNKPLDKLRTSADTNSGLPTAKSDALVVLTPEQSGPSLGTQIKRRRLLKKPLACSAYLTFIKRPPLVKKLLGLGRIFDHPGHKFKTPCASSDSPYRAKLIWASCDSVSNLRVHRRGLSELSASKLRSVIGIGTVYSVISASQLSLITAYLVRGAHHSNF